MKSKLRIIVSGYICQYPLGGVTWDYIQYLLGFHKLGHECYYFEDTDQWPYNPQEGGLSKNCDFNVNYLSKVMSHFGMENKWAYRFPWESQWFGLNENKRNEILNTADILINVSGSIQKIDSYKNISKIVYIDSDPVFTQLKLIRGQKDFRKLIDDHNYHISFGENINKTSLKTEYYWQPSRQPVVLSEWKNSGKSRDIFTTVMNWSSYNSITYDNKTYGQKDMEFMKFVDLPKSLNSCDIEIASTEGRNKNLPKDLLEYKGWKVVDPQYVCPEFESYRKYITGSKGEWSVAKNAYVQVKSGWFSCRSACYLASGKPVVTQNTGFSEILPTGRGLFSFSTLDEIIDAFDNINSNYTKHCEAARDIAYEYFDSSKVLNNIIDLCS